MFIRKAFVHNQRPRHHKISSISSTTPYRIKFKHALNYQMGIEIFPHPIKHDYLLKQNIFRYYATTSQRNKTEFDPNNISPSFFIKLSSSSPHIAMEMFPSIVQRTPSSVARTYFQTISVCGTASVEQSIKFVDSMLRQYKYPIDVITIVSLLYKAINQAQSQNDYRTYIQWIYRIVEKAQLQIDKEMMDDFVDFDFKNKLPSELQTIVDLFSDLSSEWTIPLKPWARSILIELRLRMGNNVDTAQLRKHIWANEINNRALVAFFSFCRYRGLIKEAEEVFYETLASDFPLNTSACSYMLGIYSATAEVNKAQNILAIMEKKGIPVKFKTYAMLANVLISSRKTSESLAELLLDMKEQYDLDWDINMYNTAIRIATPSTAKEIANMMQYEGIEPNVKSFSAMADAVAQHPKEAVTLADHIIHADIKNLQREEKIYILNKLLESLVKDKRKEFWTVFNKFNGSRLAPNAHTFALYVKACKPSLTAKDIYKINKFLHRYKIKPDVPLLNSVIDCVMRSSSNSIYKQFVKATRSWNVGHPNAVTFNITLKHMILKKKYMKIIPLLEHVFPPAAVLKYKLDDKDWNEIIVIILDFMRQHQIEPNANTYLVILQICCQQQNVEQAEFFLNEMEKTDGVTPSNVHLLYVISTCLDCDAVSLLVDTAERLDIQSLVFDNAVVDRLISKLQSLPSSRRTKQLLRKLKKRNVIFDL